MEIRLGLYCGISQKHQQKHRQNAAGGILDGSVLDGGVFHGIVLVAVVFWSVVFWSAVFFLRCFILGGLLNIKPKNILGSITLSIFPTSEGGGDLREKAK